MIETIFVSSVAFVAGYMVCSILRNKEIKKDKKMPFKEGI